MGINSTEVSYGFGQLGSAFQNTASKPVYPPKGQVIIAIQFLSSNKLETLETEVMGDGGAQYITTANSETQDNNYLGVTEAACDGNRTTVSIDNDTCVIEDVAANKKIKPGQYVLLVNDSDAIGTGLTVDSSASPDGTPTPIYNGRNPQGVKVVSIAGGTYGTHVTLSQVISPAATQTLVFLDEHHGAGSTDTQGAIYPTGMVIYGRWTKAQLENTDAAGGAIFYFGK
jgi:hypothetical protein